MSVMKELQFDTYEMLREEGRGLKFIVAHHYESNVKAAGAVNNVARTRRLAQEAVTLSTSLPLAYSSSVFVRCDEDRLDVMKVLIHHMSFLALLCSYILNVMISLTMYHTISHVCKHMIDSHKESVGGFFERHNSSSHCIHTNFEIYLVLKSSKS